MCENKFYAKRFRHFMQNHKGMWWTPYGHCLHWVTLGIATAMVIRGHSSRYKIYS